MEELLLAETVPGGLERFEAWLKGEGWFDWKVIERGAEPGAYRVDAGHLDFLLQQVGRFGLTRR